MRTLLAAHLTLVLLAAAAPAQRPRLLVLTDIGGDPDDQQSMRRLMLYANEFDIVGLVASASGTPGEVGRAVTRPELIEEIVGDYAAVRDRLATHAPGYPPAEQLLSVVRSGSPQRGEPNLGAGRATPGSRLITSAADALSAPLHIAIWGGAHDLAQALLDVRETRSRPETDAFVSRLRVYAIADQDAWGAERGTGEWIREHFPNLRYVEAGPPGMDRFTALFRGMYQNDSKGGRHAEIQLVRDAIVPLTQQEWADRNVRTGHGPLGAGYPLVKQNPGSARNTAGVKEGDTPSWFYVLPNGLSDPDHPEYGGWGGRFQHDQGGHYVDAEDAHWSGADDAAVRRKWTVARWREAYQNDFATRLDWCVAAAYSGANHNPVVVLNGDKTRDVLRIRVKPRKSVRLSAAGTKDPDGDRLSFNWFVYREPSGFTGRLDLQGASTPSVRFTAPDRGEIHVVCEVKDKGEPNLFAYRRAIVTVE
ncbi:MAG: DUF1593 domain-containing protein [Bryobacteraceae bacterium]|nr:DUF1593 domain-containing protein [Bryobacteraceae bacterium]